MGGEGTAFSSGAFPFCSAHWVGGEFCGVLPALMPGQTGCVCELAHTHVPATPHTGLRCRSLPGGGGVMLPGS